MSYYIWDATHFWEYESIDATNNVWERYDPSVQEYMYDSFERNSGLGTLKIEDTDFEIKFDHGNGSHMQRDVNTGSECAVRKTPEVVVKDWSVFKKMTDVSKITKLLLKYINPNINDHDIQDLTSRLASCTSLQTLNLYGFQLTDAFGVVFSKALATNTSLSLLILGGNKFGEDTGVAFGAALMTNTSLHTIDLHQNQLKAKGAAAIIRGLTNNTTLRVLKIGSNQLGTNFKVVLHNILANKTALYDLDLSRSNLGDLWGVAIATWLATNTTLKTLRLRENDLGEKSGVEFANALTNNTSLSTLRLDNNNLGIESGVAFGKVLATNTSLRVLELGYNNLGDAAGVVFAKSLTTNTSLRYLYLGGNTLGDEFGAALGKALVTNTSLEELYLGENKLGNASGVAFGQALATNTSLRVLTLEDNNLGDTTGVVFGKSLATNTSLRILFLYDNKLGEESAAAFVEGLSQNSTLKNLELDGNDAISPAARAKIKFALSPELKGLLNTPSVSPSRIPVCVVGFDNVGKTELVNTWHRTTAHETPHLDPEETAEAKSDDERDKTSGISIKPITLKFNRQDEREYTVEITGWDFAGHGEYYVSYRLVASGCRDALFVVLFRIDRLLHPDTRKAEIERLFFWLRFVTTMRSVHQHQHLPTVFIGGSFRPNNDVYDPAATSEWTDWVLHNAKQVFGCTLNIPQQKVHLMDCRKCYDPHVVALRNTLAEAVEATRTRENRKIPPICETARSLLHRAKQEVTSKLESYEQDLKACQSNPNASVTRLSWVDTVCSPIMTRSDFEEHVLGELEVKADAIGHNNEHNVSFTPKSKQLLQIITSYLHDVGDILWFDVDGLRDTVILTPDLFCSKIIGAVFRPDAPGFCIDAVHGGGGLMRKSTIVTTFKRALGIDDTHVDAALAMLCQLGLCYRHQDQSNNLEDSYLFPGALTATSYRRPEWFGSLTPGQHFVVGRRFTLVDPATTIFDPGCLSEIQVWVLGRFKGSMIWRDGVIIPFAATQTLAEAGVQLHRPHSSSQDGDKCAQVSMSSITLVVRGSDAAAQPDCLRLLNELCAKIRATSGTQLVEEALPPNEVTKSSTNNSNMLDVTCPGFAIPPNLNPAIHGVVVGGNSCTIDSLKCGSFVDMLHPVSIHSPKSWTGKDFEPVCAQAPTGGAHLLVEIPRDHADFTRIETNMRRSMPSAVIRKIQRVQNRALWNKYFPARSDIREDCDDGSPNEIEAWHSTGTTDPWLICSDWKVGFDVNRSIIEIQYGHDNLGRPTTFLNNAKNKSYGTGVYLAEHCIYPDTLFPHVRPVSQDKQIILAKVTLGNNFDYGANVPKWRSGIEPEDCHSISGTEGDMKFLLQEKQRRVAEGRWTPAWEDLAAKGDVYGRQYVVHRSNQVYPAYLVTYK